MSRVEAYGIAFDLPAGWDGRIYRRPAEAPETTHPVLHAANFGLPRRRGDYGSGAVEIMGPDSVFLALLEFHPSAAESALFSARGKPAVLDPAAFSPAALQRALPGQAGTQAFFSHAGRAFCLYVVVGSWAGRGRLVPEAARALASVTIGAAG